MSKTIRRRQVSGDVLDPQLHPVIDRIYRARQVTSANDTDTAARNLLHYRHLQNIDSATSLLSNALQSDKKIVIVGDFDADGATSTALCMLALKAMGAVNLDYLVPNRFDFGYGLSPQIVDVAHQQGAELLMTVDSGIACFDGVQHAKSLGMQVIVTDHHLPGESLPIADAIVNPNLADCQFSSKQLAGVGVAFYVLTALRAKLVEQNWFENRGIQPPSMANWLDIVAVGTVADVVPLDKNNRILVHQGLQRIKAGKCRPGITAMLHIAKRTAKYLNASDLGFVIGPRLNAAGRLEDMALGIECLLADDIYKAREIAAELDSLNQSRKQIENEMREEAEKAIESAFAATSDTPPQGIVVYQPSFHQGVIGIVAGRIREKFNRPTVTFAQQDEENLKGSARSIPGVHIRDVFESIDKHHPGIIDKFGGHAMAAGLSIKTENLETFANAFDAEVTKACEGKNNEDIILTDGELPDTDLNLEFAITLSQAGPFGQGFEAPVFDDQFTLVSQRIVGEKHLKLVLQSQQGQQVDAIAFNVDVKAWPNQAASLVHAVYSPDINVFRDRTSLQLLVHQIQAC
jgi:single-stranded-DNA-specific exonuclease